MNLKEIGWEGIDWIVLYQDGEKQRAVVSTVMNILGPYSSGGSLDKLQQTTVLHAGW